MLGHIDWHSIQALCLCFQVQSGRACVCLMKADCDKLDMEEVVVWVATTVPPIHRVQRSQSQTGLVLETPWAVVTVGAGCILTVQPHTTMLSKSWQYIRG